MKSRPAKLLTVNLLLLLVGVLDLVTTLWWLHTGRAVEYNPLMAALLKIGTPVFVIAKLSTLVTYVAVIEWYRRRRCALFARAAGLFTLVAYMSIYAVSFFVVNRDFLLG